MNRTLKLLVALAAVVLLVILASLAKIVLTTLVIVLLVFVIPVGLMAVMQWPGLSLLLTALATLFSWWFAARMLDGTENIAALFYIPFFPPVICALAWGACAYMAEEDEDEES